MESIMLADTAAGAFELECEYRKNKQISVEEQEVFKWERQKCWFHKYATSFRQFSSVIMACWLICRQ